jgi:glutamate-1-semialdehyde 2,1-aminomutase
MILDEYIAKTPTSRQLAERAGRVLPDGVSTDTRLFDPYGIYIERAVGTRKWDVDGNEYRDFFGGHGALMLGHSHPRVTQAIQSAAARGIQFAANNPLEVEWAELIQKHIPTAERVRFAGSGTEATLLAIRIARAFTGRSKLVRVRTHYHGWHDFAVSGYNDFFDGSPAPGVLAEIAHNTLLVTPNDLDDLRRVIAAHRTEIAALLLEPLGSHFGIVPTADEYLKTAAALATENAIPVILDEVISAFRIDPAGMQGVLGLRPDLTCMGKVAAGGLPGGVVCGSERLMSVLCRNRGGDVSRVKKVFHQGTFTGNPVTASAAVATIEEVARNGLCARATGLAQSTRAQLNELFRRLDLRWRAYGRYSAFHILPDAPTETADEDIETLSWQRFATRPAPLLQTLRMALNIEGVDIGSRGTGFLSGIHQAEDVACLLAAFERALARLSHEGKTR